VTQAGQDKRTRGVGTAHDVRQQEIVDALLDLVREQGLDGVSLREVAAKAGVSLGRVQHYFRTKDQMLQAAFQRINELGTELVNQRLADAGDASPRAVIRAIAIELLPIDDMHRRLLHVGMAFTTRALVASGFAQHLQVGYGRLEELLVHLLAQARADLDPALEARLLLGLFDGLSTHTLIGHQTPETALAVIDMHLDRIFGVDGG
jgi:AcrR family transcriptional regulator